MNLLSKKWINKDKLTAKYENGTMTVENSSNEVKYLFYPQIFSDKDNKTVYLDFKGTLVEGKRPEVCIENRRKVVLGKCLFNSTANMSFDTLKYYFIKMAVPAKTKCVINTLEFDKTIKDNYKDYLNNDVLLVAAFEDFSEETATLHRMIVKYREHGFDCDAIFVDGNQGFSVLEYNGTQLLRCSYNELRDILRNRTYKQIIVHHNYDSIAAILDSTDLSQTWVDVYCYGDAIKDIENNKNNPDWIFGEYVDGLFEETHKTAAKFIVKNNDSPNYRWLFNDEAIKAEYERVLGIKFNSSAICPLLDGNESEQDVLKNISLYENRENYNQVIQIKPEKPILSVIIPSYNVSKYLKHTVYSLVNQKNARDIEILIVNDGSKDDTLKLANELKEKYALNGESVIRVIDKENGGHGSTLNVGFRAAKGKYVKVVDGDDTLNSRDFAILIDKLKNEDSDLVLTNYIEDWERYGQFVYKKIYKGMEEGITYHFDDLCAKGTFEKMGPVMSTSTYKTEMIQKADFMITEKMPYVDMELNTYVATIADTITYYNLNIYKYLLGRADQTVSNASVLRNYKKHETICFNIINIFYNNWDKLSESRASFIKNNLIIPMLGTQYYIASELSHKRSVFKEFDDALKKYPDFYNGVAEYKKEVNDYRKLGLLGTKIKNILRRR